MSRFKTLFEETGQSPWLNGLTRTCLRSGQLAQLVEAGIRGVLTLEATLLDGIARVSDPGAEGPRLSSLAAVGLGPEEICLELAIEDVSGALQSFDPSGNAIGAQMDSSRSSCRPRWMVTRRELLTPPTTWPTPGTLCSAVGSASRTDPLLSTGGRLPPATRSG